MGKLQFWVMTVLLESSNNCRGIVETEWSLRLSFDAKVVSTKQCVEPESISAPKTKFSRKLEVSFTIKELGSEKTELLRRKNFLLLGAGKEVARREISQPSVRTEPRELLTLFLTPWTAFPSRMRLFFQPESKRMPHGPLR